MDRSSRSVERSQAPVDWQELSTYLSPVTSRWKYLLPGLVAGVCVSIVYLLTHPYPAFGAGLYLSMGEELIAQPLHLPETIPHYTDRGVPFAYPPLMLYVNGVFVSWLGVDPITYTRYVPNLVSVAALVPFYLFAETLLERRRAAGLATVLVAVMPPVLQWHISAGGIVRAPAYFLTLAGLYTGLKLFRSWNPRWLAASTLCFALTLLTHPMYATFFGVSYVWMWLSIDRSVRGFASGATVALGGGLLSSPWWVAVASNHGIDVFTGASATHGGIGQGIFHLLNLVSGNMGALRPALLGFRPDLFNVATVGMTVLLVWALLILVSGVLYLLDEGHLFLPGWLFLVILLLSNPRFPYLIGTVLAAAVFYRFVVPRLERSSLGQGRRTAIRGALVTLIVIGSFSTGIAYAGSQLDSHGGSESLPQFMDDENEAAMEWVVANTDASDEFVVLGDVAEWFPYVTRRTLLVGSWGVEWRGGEAFDRQRGLFNRMGTCGNASCVTDKLDRAGIRPDYVYVPRGEYTVRGMGSKMDPAMRETMVADPAYTLVYQNDGVMIFEYGQVDARGDAAAAREHRPPPEVSRYR